MRVGYTIYPRSGYVLETLRGIVTYQDLVHFVARQQFDARIAPHYDTVSDFSRATVRLTEREVRLFADTISTLPSGRVGRRALVTSGARNLAFASLLQGFIAESGLDAQCFCDREAALRWLHGQRSERTNVDLRYFEPDERTAAVG
jgi:hypothetical protein